MSTHLITTLFSSMVPKCLSHKLLHARNRKVYTVDCWYGKKNPWPSQTHLLIFSQIPIPTDTTHADTTLLHTTLMMSTLHAQIDGEGKERKEERHTKPGTDQAPRKPSICLPYAYVTYDTSSGADPERPA